MSGNAFIINHSLNSIRFRNANVRLSLKNAKCIYYSSLVKLERKKLEVIPTIHANHNFSYHITILSVRFSLFKNNIIQSSTVEYEGSFL